jgi:hypothetical protein
MMEKNMKKMKKINGRNRPGAEYVASGKKGSKDTILYPFTPFLLSPWPKHLYPLSPRISRKSLPFHPLKN